MPTTSASARLLFGRAALNRAALTVFRPIVRAAAVEVLREDPGVRAFIAAIVEEELANRNAPASPPPEPQVWHTES